MGVLRSWGELRDLGDLPVWRKILLMCCVGLWFFLGIRHFNQRAEIYASAPTSPVTKTKQVFPVYVNHGYLRYVTKEQAERWRFLEDTTGPVIGASAVTMLLLIGTFRDPHSP